jgi:acyl-CoA reductase-like NAD-dependent aldehyde dehydrogenase
MKIGRGTEEGVQIGPLIDRGRRGRRARQDAVERGATCDRRIAIEGRAPSSSRP